jgi:hypothetical protein
MALAWLLAITLSVAGLVGVGSALFPLRLGSTEWEIAAFGQLAATMALPEIGLVLVGVLAVRAQRVGVTVLVSVICAMLAAALSLGLLLMVLNIPLVRAVTVGAGDPGFRLRLLALKTIGLSGIHGSALWFMAAYFGRVSIHLRRK